jgi:hypothetical protein
MLKKMWKTLASNSDVSELVESFQRGVHGKDEIDWHQMLQSQERGDGRLPGLSIILKFNESGMMYTAQLFVE